MSIRTSHKKHGFTLVEVVIVVGIVAVISALVLANFQEGRKKARDAERISDIAQLQIAFRLYKDAEGVYPIETSDYVSYGAGNGMVIGGGGEIDTLLSPYIQQVPRDVMGMNESFGIAKALASAGPSGLTPSPDTVSYGYVYDADYDGCSNPGVGQDQKILYAKTMERSASSNWETICGDAPPGTNIYGVILK